MFPGLLQNAFHALLHKVEEILHYKEVALGVFFNTVGTFYKATIYQTLQTRKVILTLVSWERTALEKKALSLA